MRKKHIDNPQTEQKVETHFNRLAAFLGHDNGTKVTSQNIVAFEKHLATTPDPRTGKLRHPNSVLGYLSSFRGVFTVAVQQLLIDTNPMDKVAVGSKIESKRRPYSVEQVTLILTRAQAETDDIFLPLLAQAYAGCRVAEIVDCLRRRIELRHSCGVQVRRSRRAGERASRTTRRVDSGHGDPAPPLHKACVPANALL